MDKLQRHGLFERKLPKLVSKDFQEEPNSS